MQAGSRGHIGTVEKQVCSLDVLLMTSALSDSLMACGVWKHPLKVKKRLIICFPLHSRVPQDSPRFLFLFSRYRYTFFM